MDTIVETKYLGQTSVLVHKQMSILAFEGLPITFEASMNGYFTYFFIYIIVITHD